MSVIMRLAKARSLGMQGDPGLVGNIGSLIGKGAGLIGKGVSMVPGPIGAAGKLINLAGGALTAYGAAKGVGSAIQRFAPNINLPSLPNMFGGGASSSPGSRAGLKKDGTPRRVKKNGQFWKRPSMNFGNGRAIKRAARRLEGAEELFKRVFSIRHGKRPVGVTPKKGK